MFKRRSTRSRRASKPSPTIGVLTGTMQTPRLTRLVGFATATITIAAALLWAPGDKIFDLTRVHRLHISITPNEWAVLQTSGGRSTTAPGGSDYRLTDGRLVHLSSGF